MAVAFIKRLATAVTKGWDNRIKNASLSQILVETLTRVREADPVGGGETGVQTVKILQSGWMLVP